MMVVLVVMLMVRIEREARGDWFDPTEKLPEEEASGGEHTAMSVHDAAVNAERDVAEGLAVDEEVEVVEGERLEGVVGRGGGHGWSQQGMMVHI